MTARDVEVMRRAGRRLLVVDVAEPANFKYREYKKCKDVVLRQDAGNAYSHKLEYVLGPISYKALRLNKGVAFGCFSESLAIAHALRSGVSIVENIDWFNVNEENINIVKNLFSKVAFRVPSAKCFGEDIGSFDLNIK